MSENGTSSKSNSGDLPELEGPLQHPATTPKLDSQLYIVSTALKILSEVSRALASNVYGRSGGADVSQADFGIAPGWRRCSLLQDGLGGLCWELTLFMGAALHDDPGNILKQWYDPGNTLKQWYDDEDGGVKYVGEANLMYCRVWREMVSILDLDKDFFIAPGCCHISGSMGSQSKTICFFVSV